MDSLALATEIRLSGWRAPTPSLRKLFPSENRYSSRVL